MRRKSENPLFEIWYSVVALSGGVEKNLNMVAQLQIIIRGIISVKFHFFSFGAVNPHPWTDQGEIWQRGADLCKNTQKFKI